MKCNAFNRGSNRQHSEYPEQGFKVKVNLTTHTTTLSFRETLYTPSEQALCPFAVQLTEDQHSVSPGLGEHAPNSSQTTRVL